MIASPEPTTRALAQQYMAAGFALCAIKPGNKGPTYKKWDQHPLTLEQINTQGLGLIHAKSGTCAIDLDDLGAAAAWLDAHGIDLAELLAADDAVQITSGRPNRGKLLYRLPAGVDPLPTVKVKAPDGAMMLELRCATSSAESDAVQDVLPPTIHPDTGQPYRWAGAGSFEALPELPAALLALPEGARHETELHADWAVLRAHRAKLDAAIEAWLASVPDGVAQRRMRYHNTKGVAREHPAWQALTHLFNHQTHHRGQVTTLLSRKFTGQ